MASDFPALSSESQDDSRKRISSPARAAPRAKSAKRTPSTEARASSSQGADGTLSYAKETLKVVDFGGDGDCGYRVLACMAA
eukprot:15380828-Alexandrium_andersonii.AAC.1